MARRSPSQTFGEVSKLPSGNHRARYTVQGKRHSAPHTFPTKRAAQAWLDKVHADVAAGTWLPPEEAAAQQARKQITLGAYAEKWIGSRTNSRGEPLAARTVGDYEAMLRAAGTKGPQDPGGPLAPLVGLLLGRITPETVREWRAERMATGRKTQTARAYDLLKTIMKTAVEDEIIARNPCTVKGGSTTSTGRKSLPPTDKQLDRLIAEIDDRYTALVAVAAGGGLRWGEATELRGRDVTVERNEAGDVDCVHVRVERQVVNPDGKPREVTTPKSEAGVRTVAVFGVDAGLIAEQAAGKGTDELLFTSADGETWLSQSAFSRHWRKACVAAGCPESTFHSLRHYAGTRFAQTGATLKETMDRLGHSSTRAAMRYQHSTNRSEELARRAARN